jgi:hypothetical protein
MLQLETLPASLRELLQVMRPCFTAPTFRTFAALAGGLIAAPARRSVCGMLTATGLAGIWHHSRMHRFFATARWCPDRLGLALLGLITTRLLPAGATVTVAIDDTLFRRTGRKIHAVAWCHDGAARVRGPKHLKVSWGNSWVVAGVIVRLPMLTRPVCLPVLARLWRKGGPTKPELARELIQTLAAALPDRTVHAVADSHYATSTLRTLPGNVTLTVRVKARSVFHEIARPGPKRRGRPRLRGPRIGTPDELAGQHCWQPSTVCRYGRQATIDVIDHHCLWPGVFLSRPIRVVLVGEPGHTGVSFALVSTDPATPASALVERYADRWPIEVTFHDTKQHLGLGETRNRTQRAVERTIPFGLITFSLTICWYALHGHQPADLTNRRRNAPWYRSKTEPSYLDMLVKLRRVLIAARFRPHLPDQPTPEETLAIQLAWAQAAA